MSKHLESQIKVARGRIQSARYWLRKSAPDSKSRPMHEAIIAREQQFIRTAQRAIRAEAEAARYKIAFGFAFDDAQFLGAMGY